MYKRVRRKFTSSTFCVNGQICKIFLTPVKEYLPGFYFWSFCFGIGKSNRQLNDWYQEKKNKRANKILNKMTGKSGVRPSNIAFKKMMKARWMLEPGDVLIVKCQSLKPNQQFKTLLRWQRKYPDWIINNKNKELIWYRPPYPHEDIYKYCNVIKRMPDDPFLISQGSNYLLCFDYSPKAQHNVQSNQQKFDQHNQAQYCDTAVVLPTSKLP